MDTGVWEAEPAPEFVPGPQEARRRVPQRAAVHTTPLWARTVHLVSIFDNDRSMMHVFEVERQPWALAVREGGGQPSRTAGGRC
jgi:hypothetical protein